MIRRPTYEELEQERNEIEKEVREYSGAGVALKQFKTIFDKAGWGVGIIDINGNLVYVNETFAQMHGYTPESVIGKDFSIFHLEEQMKNVERVKKELEQTGSLTAEEVWHKRKDGTSFPTLMHGTSIKDDKGNPLYLCATAIDTTEQKRTEQALRESQLLYRTLFESVPVGIGLATVDGQVLAYNDTMVQMTGYSRGELNQIDLKSTYQHPEERALILKQSQEDGFVRDFEVKLKRKDGTPYYASLNITRFTLGANDVLLTLAQDVTERRHAEQALREREAALRTQADEIQKANSALRVLLKRADEDKRDIEKHVLYNVKQLVMPCVEKMKKSDLDAEQISYLTTLQSRLNDIVSPFSYTLSNKYLNLTPTEIQVANLVKEGKTTKEIAALLNLSPRTVECHRGSVRRKMGIKKKKASLRTQLLSLE